MTPRCGFATPVRQSPTTRGEATSTAVTISEGPISIVSLKPDAQLPVAPGTPVTWTVEAAGGTAPLEYSFELFTQSSGTWTTARPYNSSATWTFTPLTPDSYTVRALVRMNGSAAQYDDRLQSSTFSCVSGPVVNAFVTTNQTFPIATPVPIAFIAQAAGGGAQLQYKFYLNDVTKGTWTLVRDWSPTNQWSWSPSEADYGKCAVHVWIRSTGSQAPYDVYAGTGFFVLLR
jgi:hypothetical protein